GNQRVAVDGDIVDRNISCWREVDRRSAGKMRAIDAQGKIRGTLLGGWRRNRSNARWQGSGALRFFGSHQSAARIDVFFSGRISSKTLRFYLPILGCCWILFLSSLRKQPVPV